MNEELSTVMTAYIRNNVIEKFSISHLKEQDAVFYCETINSLKLENELKICATIINDNTHYSVTDIIPLSFDILLLQNDKTVQKLMREVDSLELCKALKGASKEVENKIFKNVSSRAAEMLKEDMEYLGQVRMTEIKKAQEKLINILKELENNGEITIYRGE